MSRSENKRIPTLADVVISVPGRINLYESKAVDAIRGRVRSARRFVFDDAAVRRYAEVVREVPDLLCREQQFARAPYDLTWVEFNFNTFWELVNGTSADFGAASRMGFLVDHGTVYTFTDNISFGAIDHPERGKLSTGPTFMPFVYDLHRPWSFEEELAFAQQCDTSRGMLDIFTWGSSVSRLPQEVWKSLRAQHTIRTLPIHPRHVSDRAEILGRIFNECGGDLRNIVAILLLMNRPSLTTYVREEPHWRGFIKGKLRPYMAHNVVTIHADPVPTIKKIGTLYGDAVEKRRHEVRGAYSHNEKYRQGTRAGCIHEWTEHPDYVDEALSDDRWHTNAFGKIEFDNWLCTRCGGHRWWRDTYESGSAEVGYVTKQYEVKE